MKASFFGGIAELFKTLSYSSQIKTIKNEEAAQAKITTKKEDFELNKALYKRLHEINTSMKETNDPIELEILKSEGAQIIDKLDMKTKKYNDRALTGHQTGLLINKKI